MDQKANKEPTRKSIPINTVPCRQALPCVDSAIDSAKAHQAFLELFSLRLNSSIKSIDSSTWRPLSQFHYLTDQEILDVLDANSRRLRSFSFDNKSRFAVIVLPAESPYASAAGYAEFKELFSKAEIPISAYKAAGSDDIHLYIFFDEAIDSKLIIEHLLTLLNQAGLTPSPKTFSVYPADGQLSFPLQNGFAWLNNSLQVFRQREDLTTQQAIDLFLAHIAQNQISFAHLTTLIDQPASQDNQDAQTVHDQPANTQPNSTSLLVPPDQFLLDQKTARQVPDQSDQPIPDQLIDQFNQAVETDQSSEFEAMLDIGLRHIQDLAVQVVSIVDSFQQVAPPTPIAGDRSESNQIASSEIELANPHLDQLVCTVDLTVNESEYSDYSEARECHQQTVADQTEYPMVLVTRQSTPTMESLPCNNSAGLLTQFEQHKSPEEIVSGPELLPAESSLSENLTPRPKKSKDPASKSKAAKSVPSSETTHPETPKDHCGSDEITIREELPGQLSVFSILNFSPSSSSLERAPPLQAN